MKHADHTQCGAAIIETSLVLIPLLLFAGLILELTHSQQVRQVALLALYEAARAGSTSRINNEILNHSFRDAILPLYATRGVHRSPAERLEAHAKNIMHETGLKLWQIEVTNPDALVFNDFSDALLSKKSGRATLRNNYLAEQHQENIQKGWPEGRGPRSGKTVFEAHALKLELSLIYKPLVPGTGFILKILSTRRSDRTAIAWGKGYLVANLLTEVMMQSDSQQWETNQQNYSAQQTQPIKRLFNQASTQMPSAPIVGTSNTTGQRKEIGVTEHASTMNRQSQSVNDASKLAESRTDENNICDGLICCQ